MLLQVFLVPALANISKTICCILSSFFYCISEVESYMLLTYSTLPLKNDLQRFSIVFIYSPHPFPFITLNMLIRPLHDSIKLSIFFVQFSCLSRVILRNLDVLHFLTFSPFIVALKLSLFNCPLLLKNHFHSFVYIYLEFNCSFVHPIVYFVYLLVAVCCILVLDSFHSFTLHSHQHSVTMNFLCP